MAAPTMTVGAETLGVGSETALGRGAPLLDLADERTLELLARRRVGTVRRRGWLMRRALLCADLIALVVAFTIAEAHVHIPRRPDHVALSTELLIFAATLPLWVVVAKLYGLYDNDEERADHSTADELVSVFHLVTVGTWIVFTGSWFLQVAHPDMVKLGLFWLFSIVGITTARAVARAIARRSPSYIQNTVILGAGDVGQSLARKILQHPEYGMNLVGFLDADPKERSNGLAHLAVLGSPGELNNVIDTFDVERVLVAFSNEGHDELLQLVRSLHGRDVQIDIVPRLFDVLSPGIEIHAVEGIPLLALPPLHLSRSSRTLKRAFDIAASLSALAVLSLPMALIAILIKLDSRGPVFFRQVRMGTDGQFKIWKFRTMVDGADLCKVDYAHLNQHIDGDPRMFKIPDDPRATRFGRFLRRYSVDEIPQLLNVLVGEMSMVGPRPLILAEDRFVEDWARLRLDLRPGITGLWQVLGRSNIPFEEMVKLDYLYVTTWSIMEDLRLILRTVPVLGRPASG